MTAESDFARASERHGDGSASVDLALMGFGFTEMESRLYCELLRSGPASGYRLAQRIGKAAANVYQALKTLGHKGAITHSDGLGEATTYSPTPPNELLAMLRQTFEARQEAARTSLDEIRATSTDERVYSVPSVALVFERARSMLAQAEKIVLLDLFPAIRDLLDEELAAARARGVTVAGLAYERRHSDPMTPFNSESTDMIGSRWAGDGLMLVVDGCQMLLAQVTKDRSAVLNAVWTDSPFLCCLFHSGLAADIRLTALQTDPGDPMQILTLQQSRPPGLDRNFRDAGAEGAAMDKPDA
jgi:sugar-specific transcriptional regulator TrmB